MRLNVGIDGPVSAGKSSVADAVAARLGILHLDTGAMYRALGLTALRQGIDVQDEKAVVRLCRELQVSVSHEAANAVVETAQPVTEDAFRAVIADAGYELTGIK